MKRCFKCGQGQPLTEFYRHPQMADGHLNKCKTCTKRDSAATAAKNPEARRVYVREQARRRRHNNPADLKKRKARFAVLNELRACRLTRLPCEIGDGCHGRIEAHHDDYDKPLAVRWLCRKHHAALHRK